MKSLEYRDEIIDILTERMDINVETARELCEKHKAILDDGIDRGYKANWAAQRIIEIEG